MTSGIGILLTVNDAAANWNLEIGILILAGVVIAFHSFATNISAALRGVFNGVMLILALTAVYLTTIYI